MSVARMTGKGMGGHQSARSTKDEWLTPPWVLELLGPFDLDPCAPVDRPCPTAARHLTIHDDGLTAEWLDDELVWLNPPYGRKTWAWLERIAAHPAGGIALIFARTETEGFHHQVWKRAHALLFLRGRLSFHHVTGIGGTKNAGAPSVLVAYGAQARDRLVASSIVGQRVILR